MAKLEDIKCDSGLFLLISNFEAKSTIATETNVHLIDQKTLKDWFEKGEIGEEDRVFCVASELQVVPYPSRRRMFQNNRIVLDSGP